MSMIWKDSHLESYSYKLDVSTDENWISQEGTDNDPPTEEKLENHWSLFKDSHVW